MDSETTLVAVALRLAPVLLVSHQVHAGLILWGRCSVPFALKLDRALRSTGWRAVEPLLSAANIRLLVGRGAVWTTRRAHHDERVYQVSARGGDALCFWFLTHFALAPVFVAGQPQTLVAC